jgi:hypothetical protein
LERRAVEALAGRRAELERLETFASGDEPLVMHIQGIPGRIRYPKSSLSRSLDSLPETAPQAGDPFPWLRLKLSPLAPSRISSKGSATRTST